MKKQYKVWMGFVNYWGEITDKSVIATFFSVNRANLYLKECQSSESELNVIYWIG